jgi:hypothetical protein
MHRVSGWIRLHVTWAITLSLLGVLLLGSGVWLFIRTTTHSVHGVLVTGPAFVALLERETGKPIWWHRTNLNCHQAGITACAPLETVIYQQFCAGLSYNLPRSQALSEDQFSRINWRGINTLAMEACFAFQRISFQLCANLCLLISSSSSVAR